MNPLRLFIDTEALKAQKEKARQEAEARLKKMTYARIGCLSGRDAEKLCDLLGLETRGWDNQLRMRLVSHKRRLAGKP